jgi:hypothetical protein
VIPALREAFGDGRGEIRGSVRPSEPNIGWCLGEMELKYYRLIPMHVGRLAGQTLIEHASD